MVPPPILDPPDSSSRRERRRSNRSATRRRRVRRIALTVGFLVVVAVAWVAWGHTDTVGEVSFHPTTSRPVEDTADDAPGHHGPFDEPGGLITGPLGITAGATHRVVDNRLVIVGDSVMQAAAPLLPGALPTWSIIADTRVGRFLPEAIQVLQKRTSDLGDMVVLNLGNNYNGDQVAFAGEVEDAMRVLASVDHVIWLTVGVYQPEQAEVNAVLKAAVRRHSNLVLLDWDTVWQNSDGYTGADDLHLTPEGAEAYAEFVAKAVRRVARLADISPAPDPQKPEIITKGSVPTARSGSGSKGSSKGSTSKNGSGSSSSGTKRRRIASTTVPAGDGADQPATGGNQPADTSPPATAAPEPQPPATEPPATTPPAGGG
jgi:hypothetical protein